MKPVLKKFERNSGFTIVELLTILSIILILLGLLIPSLNHVRRFSYDVKQKNQFHGIEVGLEMFNAEMEGYPDSEPFDNADTPQAYCGAMKLCEAMVGQDFLGFHPHSRFRQDGTDGFGNILYPGRGDIVASGSVTEAEIMASEKERKDFYIKLESARATRLGDLYSSPVLNHVSFDIDVEGYLPVLCDVYPTSSNRSTGRDIGRPILYFKANTSKNFHNPEAPPTNIYNILDNELILELEYWSEWEKLDAYEQEHYEGYPLFPVNDGSQEALEKRTIFYERTRNEAVAMPKPFRPDTFILMSAGFDGLFGTMDDIYNFEK